MSLITPTIPLERRPLPQRSVAVAPTVALAAVAADVAAPARTVATRARSERRFFMGISIAMAVACFAGFAPSYYLKTQFGTPALKPLLHFHGAVFTLWMIMMVVQTSLISSGRAKLHRALGMGSLVLVPLMVISGAAVIYGRGTTVTPGVPHEMVLAFLAIALTALVVFPLLIGAALVLRRNGPAHKRLMVIGTTVFLAAAIHRLLMWTVDPAVTPPVFYAATDLFILALVVYDVISRGRVHIATAAGGLTVVAAQVGSLVLAGSASWMTFAHWVTGT